VISINGYAAEKFPQLLRCKVRYGEAGLQNARLPNEKRPPARRPFSSISEIPLQFADQRLYAPS
jgi:hypothetical protein